MKKTFLHIILLIFTTALLLSIPGCNSAGNDGALPEESAGEETGSIIGTARFANANDNSGIYVSVEPVVRGITATVSASIEYASPLPRSVAAQTVTGGDGGFILENLAPGDYVIYASSENSLEKAVIADVQVEAEKAVSIEDLVLTATGNVSGKALLDNLPQGNLGVLVFITGTSYMAAAADDGSFTISGIPAGTGYNLTAVKTGYAPAEVSVNVPAGSTKDVGTLTLSQSLSVPEITYSLTPGDYLEGSVFSLDWDEVPLYVECYQCQISEESSFSSIILDDDALTGPSCIIDTEDFDSGTVYYYRVRPKVLGIWGKWSDAEIKSFKIQKGYFSYNSGDSLSFYGLNEYDAQGNLSARRYYNASDVPQYDILYNSYDASGNLLSYSSIDHIDSGNNYTVEYTYSGSQRDQASLYDNTDTLRDTFSYSYDGSDRVTDEFYSFSSSYYIINYIHYTYDGFGQKTRGDIYDWDGSSYGTNFYYLYSYNGDGNLSQRGMYHTVNGLQSYYTYVYNIYGKLTKSSYYDSSSALQSYSGNYLLTLY